MQDPFKGSTGGYWVTAGDRIDHLKYLTIPELSHVINGRDFRGEPYQKTVKSAAARTLKKVMALARSLADQPLKSEI